MKLGEPIDPVDDATGLPVARSWTEIGAALGISRQAAEGAFVRARAKLRRRGVTLRDLLQQMAGEP